MYTSISIHVGDQFSDNSRELKFCKSTSINAVSLSYYTLNNSALIYFGIQAIPLLEQALSLLKEMQANESADQGADASMEGDNEQGKSTSNEWTDADERKLEEGNSNASADDDVPF